jgi:predicted ATPase
MRLEKLRVVGFQAFSDTGFVDLKDGINLIVGPNNSGKSSFLRAAANRLSDDRHRTIQRFEAFELPPSEVTYTIAASGTEIRRWVLRMGGVQQIPFASQNRTSFEYLRDDLFSRVKISSTFTIKTPGGPYSNYPSSGDFVLNEQNSPTHLHMAIQNNLIVGSIDSGKNDTLPNLFIYGWNNDSFYFPAERMSIGEAPHGHADRLDPDARNLPRVLHTLNSERRSLFVRLIEHLREIFPTVRNLTVRTKPENGMLEVRLWPTDAMDRLEFSFPLSLSGTGVSQAIAILTAIMTTQESVIIIDEINSFLHPSATKALLRIIQTHYSQHQYIISTHSPEVVSFGNPRTIHLITRTANDSSIRSLDPQSVETFSEIADQLGISMADVFAADRVIWVEGPTEELCFPYIYYEFYGEIPKGTIFTSLVTTGDFLGKKKNRDMVIRVYTKLSSGASALLTDTLFSFDGELLTQQEKDDLIKLSQKAVHFLPRRHIECYLIDARAIAELIAQRCELPPGTFDKFDIESTIGEFAQADPFYIEEWKGDISDPVWLGKVDAARLICAVCGRVSDEKMSFRKKEDSLFLTKSIMTSTKENIRPLADYIKSLVGGDEGAAPFRPAP